MSDFRIRVAGIIPMEGGYALMHRKDVLRRPEMMEYYAFPGGGIEENETNEEGVIREIKEEFGIDVKVERKLYEIETNNYYKKEIFYLCEYIGGEFGTGKGPEFLKGDPKYIDNGKYFPEIIKVEDIENIPLVPEEIKMRFLEDIKNKKV